MKLRKISIRNFRNLREVDIYPTEMSVIIGENNVGKSNLLHALRLLFDPQSKRLELDLSKNDINNAARAEGETYFAITVEIGDFQRHPEVEACLKERIDKEDDETFVTIEGRFEPDEDGIYTWEKYVLSPKGRLNDPIPMSPRMSRAVPLYFLDAVREAVRDTRATGRGLLSQLLDEVDYKDVQDDVQANLQKANSALNKGQEISDLASGLTEQLTPLVPGGQSEIVIAVADEDVSYLTRNFRLNIREINNPQPSDILRHGTGLQNLTLIAMFRHNTVASKTKGKPMLAIEEPEAHLHPHAQRRLFKELTEIDAPILLTTHSPAIVKYADPLNLVLLKSTKSNGTKAYQLKPEKIDETDLKDLSRLMRGGRADMFFARTIIIVEGQSELITLPAFAEALGCDFDRDGISIVQANGNDYAFILRSCQQFSIPAIVTYDTDVLETDYASNFLRQVRDVGLIDNQTFQSCKSRTPNAPSDRKKVLDNIGWIGVDKCFEEVICRNGYLDIAIEVIEDATSQQKLNDYLSQNNLTRDERGIRNFIKEQKRTSLKIPVARAVADAVKTVKEVPDCYAKAIRWATLESIGGIDVNEHFERSACSAGFLNIVLETIESERATENMEKFLNSKNLKKDAIGISKFLTKSQDGRKLRYKVKQEVANTIESIGVEECQKYADSIHQSTFC